MAGAGEGDRKQGGMAEAREINVETYLLPSSLSPYSLPCHALARPSPQQEEEVARREARGEGRREDPHLPCLIPLGPAPMVSFPTLHDPLWLCKWWFLGSYGTGLARSGGN